MDNQMYYDNTVSSKGQVSEWVTFGGDDDANIRVLFIGNSITRHEPAPHIGWHGDWGMAASCKEKDYVHLTVEGLKKKYGKVKYCIAQMAIWERDFTNEDILKSYWQAREFAADIVCVRISENARKTNPRVDEYPAELEKMVRYFAHKEGCKVVMTEMYWHVQVFDDAIYSVAEKLGITPVRLNDLGLDKSMGAYGLFEHEGIQGHPGDKGMRAIADRLIQAITE